MNDELPEFVEFPKMPRLSREVVVTEKIDGTNSQVLITDHGDMFVGSRNRWITTQSDNFGFAAWTHAPVHQGLRRIARLDSPSNGRVT